MDETFPLIFNYFVFGHNIGANIGMYLAINHPEKVRGLCLLAPIPPSGLKEKHVTVNSVEDLKKFKQKTFLYNMI